MLLKIRYKKILKNSVKHLKLKKKNIRKYKLTEKPTKKNSVKHLKMLQKRNN